MKPLLRSICNQIYCACCFLPPFLREIALKFSRVSTQGRCQVEESILLAAVCTSISHVDMEGDDMGHSGIRWFSGHYLRWMFSVPPSSSPVSQVPLYDESSWPMLKMEWWNAYACKWEWLRVKSTDRWEMGALWAEGIRMWILYFSFSFLLLFFLNIQSMYSRKRHKC